MAATPLLTRRTCLLAAMESTYGTAPAFSASTDAILADNVMPSVDVRVLERSFYRNDISPLAIVAGRKLARLRFSTELRGNGLVQSGSLSDAPIITRLFRACGYAATAMASAAAGTVQEINAPTNAVAVSWATGGSATVTEPKTYTIEITTGGATTVARAKITCDDGTAAQTNLTVTSGSSPLSLGTSGVTVQPTWTGSLVLAQRWQITVFPKGVKLLPVSTGFESIAFQISMDGTQQVFTGCFGTFRLAAEAGSYGRIEWDFMGIYNGPTDTAMPTPTYETALPVQFELGRLQLSEYTPAFRAISFDQNNQIVVRDDANSANGYIGVRIASRAPQGGIDPEADLVANYDFWSMLSAASKMRLHFRVGTTAGNTVLFIAPQVQYSGLTYADRNGIRTYDAGLRFARLSGDDEAAFYFV